MSLDHMPTPQPIVDWQLAAQVAGRIAPPGPAAPRAELADLVEDLRDAGQRAVPYVLDTTKMTPRRPVDGDILVVDRARWAKANTQMMSALADPIADALTAALGDDTPDGKPGVLSQTSATVGAFQVGAVLAALSSRVLGQFDPYTDPDAGRLLLVAPNVLHVERALGLDPADFRLWVCLHEQTHATQFASAPWLITHLRERANALFVDLSTSSRELARARLRDKFAVVGRAVLNTIRGEGTTLADGFLSADQRHQLEEVSAVMALLEGHADVVMDDVGPAVIRSVTTIRSKFEARRDAHGAFDVVLRKLLGMDAKIAQYRDGAAFVRAVEKKVGRDGFNAVWSDAERLPSAREIADPAAWVRRVHG